MAHYNELPVYKATYQTSIVMSNLVPATYFVKVIESNREVKTFKIIKN
jgi:hypothetical protein